MEYFEKYSGFLLYIYRNKGYLDHIIHTGNSTAHLIEAAPDYKGKEHFIEKQAVSTEGFITANGTAAVEFSREILKYLDIATKSIGRMVSNI
ncbi:hypothetical protein [Oceanobacillus sp. CFH 90083]|uniref:hypothetical protein n=1 Tax=Oceanobacillus sp. CFH 90083 TaxID=2592336 RepID=UPI00128E8075|nr:hypothetical protein [Oceanobacillus sp. CFH 90083]